MNKKKPNTFRFPYLSARFFDKPIPKIIKIIPPALNNPNHADMGSFPKKLMPIEDKKSNIGLIKFVR